MNRIAALCLVLTLAACGVDGAPIRPGDDAASNGAILSGSAQAGVTGGT